MPLGSWPAAGPTTWKVTDVYRPTGKTKIITGTGSVSISNGIRHAYDVNGNLVWVNRQLGDASVSWLDGWFSAGIASANDLQNGVERTIVSVGYDGPAPTAEYPNYSHLGNSATGTATSATFTFSMEVDLVVAPNAGSAFAVGPGAIFGGDPGRCPGGVVPEGPGLQYGTGRAGAFTNVLVGTYAPRRGGAWSISGGGASLSGTFPTQNVVPMGPGRLAYRIGASASAIGSQATSSASASDSLGGSTGLHGLLPNPSGGVYTYFDVTNDGSVRYDRRNLIASYRYDYSSGMTVTDTFSYRNSLYDPGVILGPPYQTVYRTPDTSYVATGRLLLANGAQSGAFKVRVGDSSGAFVERSVGGAGFSVPFTSAGRGSISFPFSDGASRNPSGDGTYVIDGDHGTVNGNTYHDYRIVDPGLVEIATSPDAYGFTGVVTDGLAQVGATYGGLARGHLLWRAKPYVAYTIAPNGAAVPMQPAAGWVGHVHAAQSTTGTSTLSSNNAPPYTYHDGQPNLDVEEVGTVTGLDGGGIRIAYGSAAPQRVAPGYAGAGGPKVRALGTYYDPSGPPLTVPDSRRPYLTQRIGTYRYLRFEVRSVGAANQACRFGLSNPSGFTPMVVGSSFSAEKVWPFATAGDGEWTTVEIDLLTPTMPSVSPGQIETLGQQEATRTQVAQYADDTTGGAYTWGVDYYTKPVWVLGAGSAYEIRDVRVARKDSPRVSGLAEIDPSGDHYRGALIEVDGKRSFEFIGGMASGFAYPSADPLAQAARMLGSGLAAVPPTDADWGYLGGGSPYVGGGGAIYPPLPGFADPRYQDVASDRVHAQVRWSFAQAAPDMGDVFGSGTGVSGPTPVYACEVYGSLATGVAYGAGGGVGPRGRIVFKEKASGAPAGTGIGDTQGRYGSRDPFMRSVTIDATGIPAAKVEWVPNGSTVKRVCLRAVSNETNPAWIAESRVGQLHVAMVKDADVVYRRAKGTTPEHGYHEDAKVTSFGDVAAARMAIDESRRRIEMAVSRRNGASIDLWLLRSDSDGMDFDGGTLLMSNAFGGTPWTEAQGGQGVTWFEYDSGTSGPGVQRGVYRATANEPFGNPFTFSDKDRSPIHVAEGGYSNVEQARDGQRNLVWCPVVYGEVAYSTWLSTDEAETWKRMDDSAASNPGGAAGSTGGGSGGATSPSGGAPRYGSAKYGDAY